MNYELSRLGISDLNAMQQDMMQTARKGASVVLLSPTGSGKTLAYLLPLLEKLDAKTDSLQAIVIVPSRELAMQTADVARRLCSELRVCACYGGRPAMEEHQQMRGLKPHLVAATPGRLLDHLEKGNLVADDVVSIVIDEFDKSLELGFCEQMHAILSLLPIRAQRILLSATDAEEIPSFVGTTTACTSASSSRPRRINSRPSITFSARLGRRRASSLWATERAWSVWEASWKSKACRPTSSTEAWNSATAKGHSTAS